MSNLNKERSIEGYTITAKELIKKNKSIYNSLINILFREIILKGEKRIPLKNLKKEINNGVLLESNILYWTRVLIGEFLTNYVYKCYINFKSNENKLT